jgi:hypothetical protein
VRSRAELSSVGLALSRGAAVIIAVAVTTDFYRPRTHTWPYWERELHRSLPMLLAALDRRAVMPR